MKTAHDFASPIVPANRSSNGELEKSRCTFCNSHIWVETPFAYIPSYGKNRAEDMAALDMCKKCEYKIFRTFEVFLTFRGAEARLTALQNRIDWPVTKEHVRWLLEFSYRLNAVIHDRPPSEGELS